MIMPKNTAFRDQIEAFLHLNCFHSMCCAHLNEPKQRLCPVTVNLTIQRLLFEVSIFYIAKAQINFGAIHYEHDTNVKISNRKSWVNIYLSEKRCVENSTRP